MKKFLTATAIGAMLTAGVAVAMQTETALPPKAPLTKAEMLARADARFDAADTNKDGQLSATERQAGRDKMRAGFEGRRGGRGGGAGMGERMLARVDTNGDGLISRAESRAAAEARFARIDADSDGAIEAGEGRGFRDGRGRGGGRFGMRGGRGMQGMRLAMMADVNKDGAISRAEYDAAAAQRFARMDANKDGKLDRADRPQRMAPPAQAPAPGAK
ncbi:hypothetical protein M9978_09660 [Sphingomonas sp. MG17]|uniref:EF-hand domain-containing protein n=1 Tax=Sphingomonas tagetis TaxID=2949092 RepID=A0A9X2KPG5_9SPHN|nr:hypothetical protein [Sphingomonas tagetis]MCP3730693.1 hypothetical protein [Sphingomonas tagetis]